MVPVISGVGGRVWACTAQLLADLERATALAETESPTRLGTVRPLEVDAVQKYDVDFWYRRAVQAWMKEISEGEW
jgi:hypothetical protein